MRDALKNKGKYDKRKAKVERLNVRAAIVTILEGPAQGEKRKVDYKALEVWPCNSPTGTHSQAVFPQPLAFVRESHMGQRPCYRRGAIPSALDKIARRCSAT